MKFLLALLIHLLSTPLAFAFAPSRLPHAQKTDAYPQDSRKETTLHLASSAASWAVAHAVSGALPVPFVAKATSTWYKQIDLPSWLPPDRLFGPVWTVLYSCMGVAAYRVYQRSGLQSAAMALWGAHFLLNLSWAPTFFGLKRLRPSLVISWGILTSLICVGVVFYQNNPLSGLLLLPYLAWMTFATVLNTAICKRNPTVNGYNNAMLKSDIAKLQTEAAKYAGVA